MISGSFLILIILVGFFAGVLSGLLGVGGGTIIVPGLVLLLGFSQQLAQGIALAVFVPTATLGAYAYYRKKFINFNTAVPLALGAFFGVIIGTLFANYIPSQELRKIFGVFMLAVAITLLRRE